MCEIKSTKQVAIELGIAPAKLSRAVWEGIIAAPKKGPGDSFCWTPRDIEAASWRLLHKAYKPQTEIINNG
jgi:hypothetical protein